jgi:hypothetical protein
MVFLMHIYMHHVYKQFDIYHKTDEEKQTLAQLYLHDGDTLGIDNKNSL